MTDTATEQIDAAADEAAATEANDEGAEATSTDGPDYTKMVTKAPTGLHKHYTGWLLEKTGLTLEKDLGGISMEQAIKLVQIAVSAYQNYQKSPENKQRRADEAADKEVKLAEAKVAAAKAKAQKAADAAKEAAAAGEKPTGEKKAPAKKAAAGNPAAKAAAGQAPF